MHRSCHETSTAHRITVRALVYFESIDGHEAYSCLMIHVDFAATHIWLVLTFHTQTTMALSCHTM